MERRSTVLLIAALLLIVVGLVIAAVLVVNMEEVKAEAEAQASGRGAAPVEKPPVVKVPVKDPEAAQLMKKVWGEPVSAKQCTQFFRIWHHFEEAGLTETTEGGEKN